MDVKDIKRLLEAVAAADISELAYETGDFKISVKRGGPEAVPVAVTQTAPVQVAPVQVTPQTVAPPTAPPAPTQAPEAETAAPDGNDYDEVTAPIVGTFYSASAPDSPPFVKVGDRVAAGTVLCIIEAMKLMNEIEAESAGTVAEILVSNEDPVEYGQVLFRIDPG